MEILLTVHSILRWIIILVAGLAILKYFIGWVMHAEFKGMDRGLVAGLSGLLDLQVLLGLVLFLWSGLRGHGFPAYRWEHLALMILAAALGHVPSRFKTMDSRKRFSLSALAILGSLVLVFLGVLILPGGWAR